MRIYTRTGDRGDTSLYGGRRVPKDSLRVEAYGTVDELNSVIGMVLAEKPDTESAEALISVQAGLFAVGADLATPGAAGAENVRRIQPSDTAALEAMIDTFDARLKPLTGFIHPGGSAAGAKLHFARSVCRRAERCVIRLSRDERISDGIVVYLNRLSDLLFVLARYENHRAHQSEISWHA